MLGARLLLPVSPLPSPLPRRLPMLLRGPPSPWGLNPPHEPALCQYGTGCGDARVCPSYGQIPPLTPLEKKNGAWGCMPMPIRPALARLYKTKHGNSAKSEFLVCVQRLFYISVGCLGARG